MLLACGGRSSLPDLGSGSGSGSEHSTGPVGLAPKCVADPPIAITKAGSAPAELNDMILDGGRIFVATQPFWSVGELGGGVWNVNTLSSNLAMVGPTQTVLTHPPDVLERSSLQLAVGSGHRGAIAWDNSDHLRFVAIADDGSAAAPPVPVTEHKELGLFGTPDGFTAIVSPESFGSADIGFLLLDAGGGAGAGASPFVTLKYGGGDHVLSARLDDGSYLVAWAYYVQHFSQAGDALSKVGYVPGLPEALASMGASAMIAWTAGSNDQELWVGSLNVDGGLESETRIATAEIRHVAITPSMQGALIAWSAGPYGSDQLFVQPVSASGAADGGPLALPTPSANDVRLVGTPGGAVLAYEGNDTLQPIAERIFARRIHCVH